MINVTKTYLPSLDEYTAKLKTIWQNGWITNSGSLAKELADKLSAYLSVPYLELVANGMLALQLAIKVLGLKGEIITTPFSYVATTMAILWEGCEPVFVDIEEKTFCINADLIEAAITEQTSAILATHVYGYPCDVEKIEQIAQKHNLKVIYDAAHAFGVKLKGKSLANYGDVSSLSFHATKLFHTGEGGAVVCKDAEVAKRISLMKKFGHTGEEEYLDIGINAKMSELHAAMGLVVLPMVDEMIAYRKKCCKHYDKLIAHLPIQRPAMPDTIDYNFSYYPVVFRTQEIMMRVRQALIENNIMPRRYFYPSLNTLPYLRPDLRRSCPVSESIASRVLCLPLYFNMQGPQIGLISESITKAIKTGERFE